MREQWHPAAVATPTGAAESHSYCPPLCAYTSASPSTTAIALAPADPNGTSSASRTLARYSATFGGRVRDTSKRTFADPLTGGEGGGVPVERTRCWPGSATAATFGMPEN